jgi:hypothetical protein
VNTASDAHTSGTVDFDDLQSEKAYRFNLWDWMRYGGAAFKVYARSKLMNILWWCSLRGRPNTHTNSSVSRTNTGSNVGYAAKLGQSHHHPGPGKPFVRSLFRPPDAVLAEEWLSASYKRNNF